MFFITDTSFTWPPCELKTDVIWAYALEATIEETRLVSDVVEKTSTRRRSRIPCVVFEKITTRRREGVGVVVEKNEGSRRTFNKNYYDLLSAITELLIVHSRSIFRYVIADWLIGELHDSDSEFMFCCETDHRDQDQIRTCSNIQCWTV